MAQLVEPSYHVLTFSFFFFVKPLTLHYLSNGKKKLGPKIMLAPGDKLLELLYSGKLEVCDSHCSLLHFLTIVFEIDYLLGDKEWIHSLV